MIYFAKSIRLPGSWAKNTRFEISSSGEFESIVTETTADGAECIDGIVIPGMPNLHSHSFQRAMAGMAETLHSTDDDFWCWRNLMYQCANRITAPQLHAITTQLYMEMLKAGYTSVAEFHYLHHDQDGKPFSETTTLAKTIIDAAASSGIGLTLLPTLYQTSSFGEQSASHEQRRFLNEIEQFSLLLEKLLPLCSSQLQVGMAAHSLRAVRRDALTDLLSLRGKSGITVPIHIHIAEQEKEVRDCLEHFHCRPVEWICNNFDVDDSWCLIHATHIDENERQLLAARQCVVGLCPTTEANLGDGIFPTKSFLDDNGNIGIGSDSNISVNPIEELRWLEYSQRLLQHKRNRLVGQNNPHNGSFLWEHALNGGAKACGRAIDGIKVGMRADLLVLDNDHAILYGKDPEDILDTLIFAGNTNIIKDVMVGGSWVVKHGHHINETDITGNFHKAISSLFDRNGHEPKPAH